MIHHECEAIIATCIDYRLQDYINKWVAENFKPHTYDRIALAGGIKNLEIVLDQISISKRLHNIKRSILINHEDCGAYGEAGTEEKHTEDLKNAQDLIKQKYPDIETEAYYLQLDGTFKQI